MGADAHGHGHGASGARPKAWPAHWPSDYKGWNDDIWSLDGGPFCNPKNWRRNTALTFLGIFLICIPIFRLSARLEQRPVPPHFPIPSQRWCKNFGPPVEEGYEDDDEEESKK